MKTIHGALASAWANRSRTRDAPTPTNISTNLTAQAEEGKFCFAGNRAREEGLPFRVGRQAAPPSFRPPI